MTEYSRLFLQSFYFRSVHSIPRYFDCYRIPDSRHYMYDAEKQSFSQRLFSFSIYVFALVHILNESKLLKDQNLNNNRLRSFP